MDKGKENRIFWLGMHVVLTKTELPRLRQLGYEVFNPPYNSDVYDQSANMNWNAEQPTTLPKVVFNALRSYNFFYNKISPDVADILNEYFGTVIVTINPDWLAAVMKVYHGRIIYRTYGQPYSLSEALIARRLWRPILERDNFHIVPFAAETLESEHEWLRQRCTVVPYTLPLDIFDYRDTWDSCSHIPEIMVSVPNIANEYYRQMYNHINVYFPEIHYRLYGVQPAVVSDVRVVGTLRRDDLIRAYQRTAGYFYPYHEEGVCYLPPIEMMTIGGPVIYGKNSLLHKFFQQNAPGLADSVDQQRTKLDLLLGGDKIFIDEIIKSQAEVCKRYSPEYVNPIFDKAFNTFLCPPEKADRPREIQSLNSPVVLRAAHRPRIWIFAHFPGHVIRHERGRAFAVEGIPRVIGKIVEAIMLRDEFDVVVTCNGDGASAVVDYFFRFIEMGRLSVHVVDGESLHGDVLTADDRAEHYVDEFKAIVSALSELTGGPPSEASLSTPIAEGMRRITLTEIVNADVSASAVFIPHYYLFPEALLLHKPLALYLPDYTPYFFDGVAFDRSIERDKRNADIGRRLARKATAVLTNSDFTKSYLPTCTLRVSADKIVCMPMPLLVGSNSSTIRQDREFLETKLGGWQFVFYPTANRPNKKIALLLRVFSEILKTYPDIKLVLTCSLDDYAPAREEFRRLEISNSVIFLPGISESMMRWLYENATAVCITSTMEGNMPPQILEALAYDTPVVSTRLPQIVEILGEKSSLLELVAPLAFTEFVSRLRWVIEHREETIARQRQARQIIESKNTIVQFSGMISSMFKLVSRSLATN